MRVVLIGIRDDAIGILDIFFTLLGTDAIGILALIRILEVGAY